MAPTRKIIAKLKEADVADQIAYARHLCEEILAEYPDHGSTLVRYASNLIALAHYDLASEALDRAEAVVPDKRLPTVLAQRGHLLEYRGDLESAEALHLRAHHLDPADATYLIDAGSVAYRRGALKRSEEYARQATECDEGCIDEAYFNLGGCLLSQRKYEEARDCYRKALEIDPDYQLAKERIDDVEHILNDNGEQNGAPDPSPGVSF